MPTCTVHCYQKGPYLGTWVPKGIFLTFWVPIYISGSLFSVFWLHARKKFSLHVWVNLNLWWVKSCTIVVCQYLQTLGSLFVNNSIVWQNKNYFFGNKKLLYFAKKSNFFLQKKVTFFCKKKLLFFTKKNTFFCKKKVIFFTKKVLIFAKKITFFYKKKYFFLPKKSTLRTLNLEEHISFSLFFQL